jgi:D-serine deaminase-like pyridoxal phosphate-dependent protein
MSERQRERLERATADLDPPFAVVDLEAFWANAADMERRAVSKPIRLASKSVRCRALQERVLARPGFQGTLAYTLPEALWLATNGFSDILVAYPTADRAALRTLVELTAERPTTRITIMVDSTAQLDLLDAATSGSTGRMAPDRASAVGAGAGRAADRAPAVGAGAGRAADRAPVRVCLELDAGLWRLRGRVRIGAKRSPVHTPAQALALAQAVLARPGVQLVGIMAYESQIAGLGDGVAGGGLRPLGRSLAIRLLQAASARELA